MKLYQQCHDTTVEAYRDQNSYQDTPSLNIRKLLKKYKGDETRKGIWHCLYISQVLRCPKCQRSGELVARFQQLSGMGNVWWDPYYAVTHYRYKYSAEHKPKLVHYSGCYFGKTIPLRSRSKTLFSEQFTTAHYVHSRFRDCIENMSFKTKEEPKAVAFIGQEPDSFKRLLEDLKPILHAAILALPNEEELRDRLRVAIGKTIDDFEVQRGCLKMLDKKMVRRNKRAFWKLFFGEDLSVLTRFKMWLHDLELA